MDYATNREYYYHEVTQESTWECPDPAHAAWLITRTPLFVREKEVGQIISTEGPLPVGAHTWRVCNVFGESVSRTLTATLFVGPAVARHEQLFAGLQLAQDSLRVRVL